MIKNKYFRWFVGNILLTSAPLLVAVLINSILVAPKPLQELFKGGEVIFAAVSICSLSFFLKENPALNSLMALCKGGCVLVAVASSSLYGLVIGLPSNTVSSVVRPDSLFASSLFLYFFAVLASFGCTIAEKK